MSLPIQDEKIQAPEILDDTKAEYAQDPQAGLPTDKPDYTDGLRKSRFDSLTVGQTLWIFKRLIAYMMCTYSLTLIDMWQVSHWLCYEWAMYRPLRTFRCGLVGRPILSHAR